MLKSTIVAAGESAVAINNSPVFEYMLMGGSVLTIIMLLNLVHQWKKIAEERERIICTLRGNAMGLLVRVSLAHNVNIGFNITKDGVIYTKWSRIGKQRSAVTGKFITPAPACDQNGGLGMNNEKYQEAK